MPGLVCSDCGTFVVHSCNHIDPDAGLSPAGQSIAAIASSFSKVTALSGGNQRDMVERLTREFLDKLDTTAPQNLHVLVVDDEKFIRDTLTRMLGNCGYTGTIVS
jgi:PleD family two-component response regulator